MLPSGADVKIGAYEFFIDSSEDLGYQYLPESLYGDAQEVQGLEGVRTANPYILVWTVDNFDGGAETKFWDEELPESYWYAKANTRITGQIRPTPVTANTNKTQTATLTSTSEVYFVGVAGKLWMGCGRDLWYSTDNGATFTQHNGTALFAAGYSINGMTDDGNYVWVTASNGTTRKMLRVDSTTATTTAVSDVTTAIRATGLGRIEGKVYAWTGGHLYEYDSQAEMPITHRSTPSAAVASNIVHQPHAATPAGTYLTDFYSGICSTDTSVVYFLASSGKTTVYEFKYNAATNTFAGRKIWQPPEGFTCTHIAASMGVIYLLGTYGADIALLSMSLANRDPQILTYVGLAYGSEVGATLTARFLTASYGASVMLGVDDGTTNYIFAYDAELDALSEIDEQVLATVGTMRAGVTINNKRVVAEHPGSSTTLRTQRWDTDQAASTSNGWTWVSSAHSFKYPYDEKMLIGVQVVQDPSFASGTVKVEIQLDENGSWITTDAAGATMVTGAGVKYTNFQVSGDSVQRKFYYLRMRLTGTSGARLLNVTPRAYINSFQEKWILRLRIDEETATLNSRPTNRQVSAQTLVSYIRTLIANKNPVAFRDGWRYKKRSNTSGTGYSPHTVVLEFPDGGVHLQRVPGTDQIAGYVDVILRSIIPV